MRAHRGELRAALVLRCIVRSVVTPSLRLNPSLTQSIELRCVSSHWWLAKPVSKASEPHRPTGRVASAMASEESGNESAAGEAGGGIMGPIAARVLMKVAYAARYARFELLRAVYHLACYVTNWTPVVTGGRIA